MCKLAHSLLVFLVLLAVTSGTAAGLPRSPVLDSAIEQGAAPEGQEAPPVLLDASLGQGIEVTVTMASDGSPVAGAGVVLYSHDGSWNSDFYKPTDDAGKVARDVSPGRWLVEVDYWTFEQDYLPRFYPGVYDIHDAAVIDVKEGVYTQVPFVLEDNSGIRGTVRDADGAPVAGAELAVQGGSGVLLPVSSYSGVDGRYSIPLLQGAYKPFAESYLTSYAYYPDAQSPDEAVPVQVAASAWSEDIDIVLLPYGKISGRVTRASDGTPVEGARVRAIPSGDDFGLDPCAVTAADGSFLVEGLKFGSWKIVVSPPSDNNFAPEYYGGAYDEGSATSITVNAASTVTGIDIVLDQGGRIEGRLTVAETGSPYADYADVNAYGNGEVYYCPVGQGGFYSCDDLPPGKYTIRVSASPYLTEYYPNVYESWDAQPIELALSQTRTGLDFALDRGGMISGVVKAWDGMPVFYPQISLRYSDGSYGEEGVSQSSDSDGTYSISGIRPGEYTLYVHRPTLGATQGAAGAFYPGVASRDEATLLSLGFGQTMTDVDVTLPRGAMISGMARFANGDPAPSVDVWAYASGTGMSSLPTAIFVTSNGSGEFAFDGLQTGEWTLSVFAPFGYYGIVSGDLMATDVQVSGPEAKTVDIVLHRGCTAEGRITTPGGGHPNPGVRVAMLSDEGDWRGFETMAVDGSYRVQGIPPGDYMVFARNEKNSEWASALAPSGDSLEAAVRLHCEGEALLTGFDVALAALPGDAQDGNTMESPVLLKIGEAKRAGINGRTDADYFRFEVTTPGRYAIRSMGLMDVRATLYDVAGNSLGSESNGGWSGNFEIEATLMPGSYSLSVRSEQWQYGTYEVLVEPQGAPSLLSPTMLLLLN